MHRKRSSPVQPRDLRCCNIIKLLTLPTRWQQVPNMYLRCLATFGHGALQIAAHARLGRRGTASTCAGLRFPVLSVMIVRAVTCGLWGLMARMARMTLSTVMPLVPFVGSDCLNRVLSHSLSRVLAVVTKNAPVVIARAPTLHSRK